MKIYRMKTYLLLKYFNLLILVLRTDINVSRAVTFLIEVISRIFPNIKNLNKSRYVRSVSRELPQLRLYL